MGSWLSFPLCGEPETHVPAPMNGLVATVLLQLPFIKHMCAPLHRTRAVCCSNVKCALGRKGHGVPCSTCRARGHKMVTLVVRGAQDLHVVKQAA